MAIDINLNIHFPDLAALAALAGAKMPAVAGPSAAASAKAEDAKEAPKSPAKTAAKKAAATDDTAGKEQTEIDGKTNTGCIIMIKRVAAMDGKDEKGNDKITGVNKARAIIEGFGGVKVSELPKDKWASFIEKCQETLDSKGTLAEGKSVEEMF